MTPTITASFILRELKNANSFSAMYHLGSNPKG